MAVDVNCRGKFKCTLDNLMGNIQEKHMGFYWIQRPTFHLSTTMKLTVDISCQQGQIQEKNLDVSAKLNNICTSSIFTETLK